MLASVPDWHIFLSWMHGMISWKRVSITSFARHPRSSPKSLGKLNPKQKLKF
jgi:hypothetical protein